MAKIGASLKVQKEPSVLNMRRDTIVTVKNYQNQVISIKLENPIFEKKYMSKIIISGNGLIVPKTQKPSKCKTLFPRQKLEKLK